MGLLVTIQPVRAADATISGTANHQADGTAVTTMLVYAEIVLAGDYDYNYTDAAGVYSITIDDEGTGTARVLDIQMAHYGFSPAFFAPEGNNLH